MQYEYKTLFVTDDEMSSTCDGLTAKLNQMGKQGWELVSIIFGITQK